MVLCLGSCGLIFGFDQIREYSAIVFVVRVATGQGDLHGSRMFVRYSCRGRCAHVAVDPT